MPKNGVITKTSVLPKWKCLEKKQTTYRLGNYRPIVNSFEEFLRVHFATNGMQAKEKELKFRTLFKLYIYIYIYD